MSSVPFRALRIWVDLSNSPQVLFFRPIVHELRALGHTVVVTARRFAETIELARDLGAIPVGSGYIRGRSPLRQKACFHLRTLQLWRFARRRAFDLAASHGSHAQARAAAWLGLPTLAALDYEHVMLGPFRRTACLLTPAIVPAAVFLERGFAAGAIRQYPGLKEEVYLHGFRPQAGMRGRLRVPEDSVLVAFRPPSDSAHYLNGYAPIVADGLLAHLLRLEQVRVVLLPRSAEQRRRHLALARRCPRLLVTEAPVDAPSLILASDMVVTGGGTMGREAAVLGVPAVSCFPGRVGAVDQALAADGRLRLVREVSEVSEVRPARRPPVPPPRIDGRARSAVLAAVLETATA